MGLGGGFLCNRKERGSELFPWWGNVFLCMNSSGQQHYEGYVKLLLACVFSIRVIKSALQLVTFPI